MSQLRAVKSVAVPEHEYETCRGLEVFYKADHPRGIDRFIDFFGDGRPEVQPAADRCGELLLESLA